MTIALFSPLSLRSVTLKNRIAVSPMCQYSAGDGFATDWHLVHLGKFAQGGAGLVFTEATAVSPDGRITHGDLGIWSDDRAAALARITAFLRAQGAVPAIQLGHAGRKASMQRPWFGNAALSEADRARGDVAWDIVAPSALPVADGWLTPRAMTPADIARTVEDFAAAARRAAWCGFDVAEIHAAHGYLLASFLSPVSNRRTDGYGGDRAGRARALFETVEAVRAAWPADKPLFVRISAVDGAPDGWTLDDSVWLAGELARLGVDVIDCSSGGISGPATAGRTPPPGFQVPYAARIRAETGLLTQAVGLITEPAQAAAIVAEGKADIVALGREILSDPNWPLHAADALGAESAFESWPQQYGWWLARRRATTGRH
ncbi:NADH:flavin oxidoreductase/NADH oxidase [Polymorphum gilvum]|uniref:NADH:flavin oxidoreductase / NADH oxidase family protein n=1 Tax=Polymorphum gilvum (strain LMG 25793 / CGMCC 1.9160 / SL003B-26A1) TaxID=991905 RepID=F2IWB6_POLGS|nr:NADH:flavin oxidoreductase/NADH oxidase [Polymorphum gilvum]ADZ71501.1 NADH:flavin oxidoreductase / NADH oxidase family protein [Polymorphum gilvum SL003B-26A1]